MPHWPSSDAEFLWRRNGDEYVLNGHKWWASGAMDPRCRLAIFMGKTDPGGPPHRQQSMVLVPLPAAGARVVRPLSVFGYDDAPHGHAEMLFEVSSVMFPVARASFGWCRQSVILVPLLARGVRILRPPWASKRSPPPHGHGEVLF